jgi:hypothetical protein
LHGAQKIVLYQKAARRADWRTFAAAFAVIGGGGDRPAGFFPQERSFCGNNLLTFLRKIEYSGFRDIAVAACSFDRPA